MTIFSKHFLWLSLFQVCIHFSMASPFRIIPDEPSLGSTTLTAHGTSIFARVYEKPIPYFFSVKSCDQENSKLSLAAITFQVEDLAKKFSPPSSHLSENKLLYSLFERLENRYGFSLRKPRAPAAVTAIDSLLTAGFEGKKRGDISNEEKEQFRKFEEEKADFFLKKEEFLQNILSGCKDKGEFAKHSFSYIAPGEKHEFIFEFYINLNRYYEDLTQLQSPEENQEESSDDQESTRDSSISSEEEGLGRKRLLPSDMAQNPPRKKKRDNTIEEFYRYWTDTCLQEDVKVFSTIEDFEEDFRNYFKHLLNNQRKKYVRQFGGNESRVYQ